MQNEVTHICYQEKKTGSDSSSLGQFIGGNITQEICPITEYWLKS